MNQTFNIFNQPEMPVITLCNPYKDELYSLSAFIYNTKLTKRFNALGEFEFEIPSTIDGGKTEVECYSWVQAKRLVYILNEGYFIIDSVEEKTSGEHHTKIVKSKSLEGEMLNKRLTAFKGTYKFYNLISTGTPSLLEYVVAQMPTWSLGFVDSSLWAKYRTFDINDTTIYGFLMNDVEKAYECVFVFDTIAKTINAYSLKSATTVTDIYLSYENLIKNSSFTEIIDEIVTSLYVIGSGTLNISAVNPLGTNRIYNLDYYRNTSWMSQGLIDAINVWEGKVNAASGQFTILLGQYRTKTLELLELQAQAADLKTQYSVKETEQKLAIEAGQDITTINDELLAIKAAWDAKLAEIVVKQAELAVIKVQAKQLSDSLAFNQSLTPDQLKEGSEFLYENTYQNSAIVVTKESTAADYIDAATELYNQGVEVLKRCALPRYEFKMDTANFVAMKQFQEFTNQLQLGCTVTVNVNDKYLVIPVLLEIVMSYDKPEDFSLTFSNRLRLDGGNYQYSDLMSQGVTGGGTVSAKFQQWSDWDDNYKDTVSEFITSALDASLNEVINAKNQEITINGSGLRGKTLIPSTGLYDPNQVWLTSNLLVFTSDAWNTARLALGKIKWNGNTVFGLVKDEIKSKIIKIKEV